MGNEHIRRGRKDGSPISGSLFFKEWAVTVKELIQELEKYDGDLEVWFRDWVEGNDDRLSVVELVDSPINDCDPEDKPYKIVMVG